MLAHPPTKCVHIICRYMFYKERFVADFQWIIDLQWLIKVNEINWIWLKSGKNEEWCFAHSVCYWCSRVFAGYWNRGKSCIICFPLLHNFFYNGGGVLTSELDFSPVCAALVLSVPYPECPTLSWTENIYAK